MSNVAVQPSFNSGEWAPALAARVDLQKYHSGAVLLENFFVDYRGGATSRFGTKFVLPAYKTATPVRLISFQATFNVGYVLEFGEFYMRPFFQGSPILEAALSISGITQANPCVITTTASHGYSIGDWIYISGIVGMTQLNNQYYKITAVTATTITIAYLDGPAVNSTAFSPWTSLGTTRRVLTIVSPFAAIDLALVKFTQNINQMIFCHPAYYTKTLTLVSPTSWVFANAQIGSTTVAPGNLGLVYNLAVASVFSLPPVLYQYAVVAIDANGQKSPPTMVTSIFIYANMASVAGSIWVYWDPVPGAIGYNVYKATISYFGVPTVGVPFGFIGSCTGTGFVDTNIAADFTQTPPITKNPLLNTFPNPFAGAGIASITVTSSAVYTTVPSISIVGAATSVATAHAVLAAGGIPGVAAAGTGYVVDDYIDFGDGIYLCVASVGVGGAITSYYQIGTFGTYGGTITVGSVPTSPIAQVSTTGSGTGATVNLPTWGIYQILIDSAGAGYTSIPLVVPSSGAGTAVATLQATSPGYPSVPGFCQQRLVLAAPAGSPQTFYMSQPGYPFNFDITNPIAPSNAITGTLVSGVLNNIKAIVSSTSGMLLLTDQSSWIINGGQSGSAITPSSIVANEQSYIGCGDVPPILANYDVLFVSSKGCTVRDLAFNIYYNVFTGSDISTISSHLFENHKVLEWAWAIHPFYTVWAIREDGWLLSLAYVKEQEFVAWAHHITTGTFKSVAVVTELDSVGDNIDAVYLVVERNNVKYIERMQDRVVTDLANAWCVDAGLKYTGSPTTTFSGARHLAGQTVTGLADGNVITPFVMPANGAFTLPVAASTVIIGLSFIPKLKTLALDLGDPSVQGKVKKIAAVDIRVVNTLGLTIGPDFNHLTPMKDLILGNVSSMLTGQESQVVNGLVSGDARTFLPNSAYTVPGQYCIEQPNPYPAQVLGTFPVFEVGDSSGRKGI